MHPFRYEYLQNLYWSADYLEIPSLMDLSSTTIQTFHPDKPDIMLPRLV